MTIAQDARLVYDHLAGPSRGLANGSAVNALHRIYDSHTRLLTALDEMLTRFCDEPRSTGYALHEDEKATETKGRLAIAKTEE